MEARGRPRSQGSYYSPSARNEADRLLVRLCRYPRVHRQWFHDAHEVYTLQHCRLLILTPRERYLWLYIIVLKSFLVYVSDIFTAITMLSTNGWSNEIFNQCDKQEIDGCVAIPFQTGKWLFVGCIIFSFLLVCAPHFRVAAPLTPLRLSWHTKHASQRKLLPAEISHTHSLMSWPITTTLSVCPLPSSALNTFLTFSRLV